MKATYEKPVIKKLQSGLMNKYGSSPFYSRKVRDTIAGAPVEELAQKYGSPLFVYDEKALREKFRTIHDAFATRYPDVLFGWSYKTNYLQAICAVMHSEGAIAEVVSGMEYHKARKLGIDGRNIIFNGPYKSREALEKAVEEGAMIHVDHLDEIADLEDIARERKETIKIGMRLNMDTGIQPQWSRFGFNLDSGQAYDVVKRIKARGLLEMTGLHCHIGTFIMEPKAYAMEISKMVQFMYEIRDKFGYEIRYLDIGGGLPSKNRLKGVYLPPDVAIPTIDEYAEAITDALYESLEPGHTPRLILEPGRAMVEEAGSLISTVNAVKRLPDGRRAYVIDGGVNILFTSNWYKFNIEPAREMSGMNENAIIYGPLCMNIDVIDEGIMLPPMKRGDRVVISPVGAYNVTQWMQFIEYRPNVVMVGENGEVDIIREAEQLEDIDRREVLPERLAVN